jgi:hypothetical protein
MNICKVSRLRITILLIIICAFLVNIYQLAENIIFSEKLAKQKLIFNYDRRFISLRQVLPKRGVVGFITDVGKDEYKEAPETRILTAQYALAPIILRNSLNYPLIVGHFRNPTPDFELYRNKGLIPLRDFGSGIILFKREY